MKSSLFLLVNIAAVANGLPNGIGTKTGGIFNYTIDGVDYPGHYPWLPEEGQESIQRRWYADPLNRADHPYLACNRGNPLATKNPTLHATVKPGSWIVPSYRAPPCPASPPVPYPTKPSVPGYEDQNPPSPCNEYPWSVSQGPMIVYMADCQGPCDQWDGHGKRWFKIWEAGFKSEGWEWSYSPGERRDLASPDRWWQDHVLRSSKGTWNVTVPNLKPGHYMIRHEAIDLEVSLQIYPHCAQLEVVGDGEAYPSEDYLVEFPGAYDRNDEGLWMAGELYADQIGHRLFNYTIPGPKLWDPSKA
ncbi:glycoside hydrolase family 61 protein [Daldinia sp. EC12]|nr:glycoside hydrolase family 61 protein [Daldinia eschscholtzii]OTB12448.1 glycoside hydrolase family 61 protein [Daldinia sp. EC12]